MNILTIAKREIKLGFRQSWTYAFLVLLTLFTIAILLLQSGVKSVQGYTDLTGTVINMSLYLLPLITLLLGSVSVTLEKEDGHWGLLSTYPISSHAFLWGKWLGLAVILLTINLFSFGLSGTLVYIFGKELDINTLIFFLIFSTILAFTYLSMSFLIGAIVNSRWQSLIISITVWFVTIVIWPLLLISTLSHLPSYNLIRPFMQIVTLLNPAEFIRVFSMMKLGAGSAFGVEYYEWMTWSEHYFSNIVFIIIILSWIVILISMSSFIWERSERK